MVREKASKGKIDPSRVLARHNGGGISVDGPGGRGDLPHSADTGSWRCDAVEGALQRGNPGCNSADPDHNAGKSRRLHDIHCHGKLAAGEALPQEWPCPLAGGAGQWQPIMAGWNQHSKRGDLFEGCQAGTLSALTAGSHTTPPAFRRSYTSRQRSGTQNGKSRLERNMPQYRRGQMGNGRLISSSDRGAKNFTDLSDLTLAEILGCAT